MRQTRSATGPLPEIDHQAALSSSRRPAVRENERRRKLVTEQRRMWRSNGKAFLFFSLPPEVRQVVIRALFSVGDISTTVRKTLGPRSTAKFERRLNGVVLSPTLGFLFSCRQAYEEARRVLYSENRFFLYPRDVPGFLDNIGHANRMAMATTICLRYLDVEDNDWPNFCALASEMPLRALDIKALDTDSLESSTGAAWVKDLARISSLKSLSLSFTCNRGLFCSIPDQPSQRFLDFLQEELERTKGRVSHQEVAGHKPTRHGCCSSSYIHRIETFTMGSAAKFTLKLEYCLPTYGGDNINNGHHHPHGDGNHHQHEIVNADGVIDLEDPQIDDGSEGSDGEE